MPLETWQVSYVIFPGLILLHLFAAPYTKVEESFNLQATHDILAYGLPTSNIHLKFKALFDHMTFPGAVPRTFIGALILSAISKPFIWLLSLSGKSEQSCVRACLGLLNASALICFTKEARRAYGPITALWYTVFQASQYHVVYYASRTLPNTFAFCMSTFALSALLPVPTSQLGPVKRVRLGLYLLTLATVIFRSELALLLGSHGLWLLFKHANSMPDVFRTILIPSVVPGAVVGLVLTVGVDTYFWQSSSWLWPELSAFLSNVFPSKDGMGASEWGVSPWHWYFTSALPRLMMNQVLLLPLCLRLFPTTQRSQVFENLIPSMLYTGLYSFLAHKETRFLFPVVPSLTLTTAIMASWVSIRMKKNLASRFFTFFIVITTVTTAIISHCLILPVSALNYPGGQALEQLYSYHYSLPCQQKLYSGSARKPYINVHLTNLALQSGVTRFLEQPDREESCLQSQKPESKPLIVPGSPDGRHPAVTLAPKPTDPVKPLKLNEQKSIVDWRYDKSSNDTLFLEPDFWTQFHYVIVEDPARVIGAWEIVQEVKGIGRPRLVKAAESDKTLLSKSEREMATETVTSTQELLHAIYGKDLGEVLYLSYAISHDILCAGYFSPGLSLTGGYWIEWPLQTRLYILKSTHSGVLPNNPHTSVSSDEIEQNTLPGLPAAGSGGSGKQVDFDALGPLVVNKDGTLSRLENWQDMTQQERKKTVEYLRKRNQLRLEDVAVE